MGVVAGIGLAVAGEVPAFDAAALAFAHAWRQPALDAVFAAITWLGSLAVLLPLTIAVAIRLAPRLGWRAASFAPAALLATAALAHFWKVAFERARPELFPSLTAMPPDASFPSAHSAQAAAVALALLLQGTGDGIRRPAAIALLAGLFVVVAAVAASRIYLQVHFPSDVIAGIALAAGVVLGLRALPAWRGREL